MFVKERQRLILEDLRKNGQVRVKDLSQQFQVSEDLIRKDLAALQQQGYLQKIYGGGVYRQENTHHMLSTQRKLMHVDAKEKIVEKAYELIRVGMFVFLDISSFSVYLAQYLVQHEINITVVTNMVEVVNILAPTEIKVICVGGEFDYGHDGFVGTLTNQFLEKFRFDLAFLGCVGIDVFSQSIMTYMANDGATKANVIQRSKQSYLLCEYDKFFQLGNYTYAMIDEFTGLISDRPLPVEMQEEVLKTGTQWIL